MPANTVSSNAARYIIPSVRDHQEPVRTESPTDFESPTCSPVTRCRSHRRRADSPLTRFRSHRRAAARSHRRAAARRARPRSGPWKMEAGQREDEVLTTEIVSNTARSRVVGTNTTRERAVFDRNRTRLSSSGATTLSSRAARSRRKMSCIKTKTAKCTARIMIQCRAGEHDQHSSPEEINCHVTIRKQCGVRVFRIFRCKSIDANGGLLSTTFRVSDHY